MEIIPKPYLTTLTKQGFWNDLMEKYPGETNEFRYWIDKYKARVGWDAMFGGEIFGVKKDIKFHDLPTAMQIGIFIQFTIEEKGRYEFITDMHEMHDYIEAINNYFFMEHDFALREHQDGKYL